MLQRENKHLSSWVVLLVLVALLSGIVSAAEPVFTIGSPDALTAGFGLADRSYETYAQVFTKPVVYTVGKSKLTDWPFIHPSVWDTWAGGGAHTFTVKFNSDAPNSEPLYLHLGLTDTFRTSTMIVAVNGKEIGKRAVPGGSGGADVAFDPYKTGKASVMTFALEPTSVKAGENAVTLTLDAGSWIVYDYVQLTGSKNPAEMLVPKEPDLLADFLAAPMADIDEIVFACRKPGGDGHWYANFGYYAESTERKTYTTMGRLCKLNLRTGELTVLLEDLKGSIRDPQIHYDGEKMVFSYRKGGTEHFHLYEMNVDGTGLRQITDAPFDDIEPTYLPDGDIVFCSSRCNRWVNCWLTQVAVLYRCDGDGGNIRQISANNEHENTPWPLPDGRLLYQRWEYVDRSQVHYHHLWTIYPDGTGLTVYYGNMHPGIVMIDAKPIPGTDKIAAIFSPGHGSREHDGAVTVVTAKSGPDDKGSNRRISRSNSFRDVYPFTEDCFLAAQGDSLVVMDGAGRTQQIYKISGELARAAVQCHEPRPIIKRKRERIIPSRVAVNEQTGKLILTDVYKGRNMEGVKRGDIKKLLVLETLPMPIHYTGGMEPLTYGGSFTLERVLGTIDVEDDGSAYMELPANRGLFFVALDADGMSVKRMQSFVTIMPGETTGCIGCHEQRTQSPHDISRPFVGALRKAAQTPKPIENTPDVFDFPRDIQPILDKHCVKCHDTKKRKGGVLLTGDHGSLYSHSYFTLSARQQIADGRNRPISNYPPRGIGSSASPLMHKIRSGHHNVKLSDHEITMVSLWLDCGAPYPGTYAALGNGMIGGYKENQLDRSDTQMPSVKAAMDVLNTTCASCHSGKLAMPQSPSDNMGMPPWAINYGDPKLRFSRHILYNLSHPQQSVQLLAPLSKKAGGYGMCVNSSGKVLFADTSDERYLTLLKAIEDVAAKLDRIKRFDMPGFRPPMPYVREMKKYGVLPHDLPEDSDIDVYATDRAYWQSLWYKPQLVADGTSSP